MSELQQRAVKGAEPKRKGKIGSKKQLSDEIGHVVGHPLSGSQASHSALRKTETG